ncbi:MAG: PfkB family carbohydrate kinase [Actinomycetota bacterium]|nr:PfkB family carbohydrate kinase [Actinomycetota bacterium]
MRTAVIGHVEWVQFARVDDVPEPGSIIHASRWWEEPAGGGPGAAVQLMKLAGECTLYTALGDDDVGWRCADELRAMGLGVQVAWRSVPSRRAFTHISPDGERTITVLGDRLAPTAADALEWEALAEMDAVFFTAGNVDALRLGRAAPVLVATSRVKDVLRLSRIQLDGLVGSTNDPSERYREGDLDPAPRVVVATEGPAGGTVTVAGQPRRRFAAPELPGPVVDNYGAGDSFAGGFTYGLGAGYSPDDAVRIASLCGAAAVTGNGPYETQLTSKTLQL